MNGDLPSALQVSTIQDVENMEIRKIKLDDSKKVILNKIRAFKYKNYDSVYINFKGFKFEYKK